MGTAAPWLIAVVLCTGIGIFSSAAADRPRDPDEQVGSPRPITAADLLSLQTIDGLAVSADGRHLAFQLRQAEVSTNSHRVGWYVADAVTRRPATYVGDGGDPIMVHGPSGIRRGIFRAGPARWSPDNRWITYRLQKRGEVQIWRSSADGAVQEQLTRNAADVQSFEWAPDGSRIFFLVGRPRLEMAEVDRKEGQRGYIFDASFAPFYAPTPLWGICMDHPHNRMPKRRACKTALWVLDMKTGIERQATAADKAEYEALFRSVGRLEGGADTRDIRSVYRSADGVSVAWLENEDPTVYPGRGAPLTIFASTAPEERCGAPECKGYFSGLWWRDDLKEIFFVRREGIALSTIGLYAWKPSEQNVRTILRTEDLVSDCHFVGNRAICLRSGPTHPERIVAIDLISGTEQTLVDPNPRFHGIGFTNVEKIEWQDGFSNDTFGHLVYPAGYREGRQYPLVVVQYRSRGFLLGGTGNEYPIHLLAANGFAVLSFDRPSDWRNMGRLDDEAREQNQDKRWIYKRRRALTALEIILDRLDDRGIIDPDRVGITGLSDGSETAFFSLIHSDRFAAAVVSGGTWEPARLDLAGQTAWFDFMQRIGLGRPGGPHSINWPHVSISLNTRHVMAPILMQVADHEMLLSLSTYTSLKEADKPVEMLVFPDEYHIKWQPRHRYNIYRRNVQWFKFWFMDQEDPNPVDPEQYVRWRKLREQHEANQRALEQAQRPSAPGERQTTAELGGE